VDQAEAIVIASIALGACLLTNTGYTLVHDRSLAESERVQRERTIQAEKEAATKAKARGAWERATKDLDTALGSWINEQGKATRTKYVFLRWAWVRSYQHAGITWTNPSNVTVKGIVIGLPDNGDTQYYSWSRDLVWLDNDT